MTVMMDTRVQISLLSLFYYVMLSYHLYGSLTRKLNTEGSIKVQRLMGER